MGARVGFSGYHGVTAFPEYAGPVGGRDNELVLRRAGWGAIATQKAGTSNWFHIPVSVDNETWDFMGELATSYIVNLHLALSVGKGAVLDRVHIRSANVWDPSESQRIIFDSGPIQVSDTFHNLEAEFDPKKVTGGLNVSAHVSFNSPRSEVTFWGVNVQRFNG